MEIAFYEKQGQVTIYAVRNTARSNAHRLGLLRVASKLLLARREEAKMLLREVVPILAGHGLAATVADPGECVTLSVSRRLLHQNSQSTALVSLKRKYEKLQDLTTT